MLSDYELELSIADLLCYGRGDFNLESRDPLEAQYFIQAVREIMENTPAEELVVEPVFNDGRQP